jgi:hypothetical protein
MHRRDFLRLLAFAGAAVVIAANMLIIWRESRVRRITGERIRAKF